MHPSSVFFIGQPHEVAHHAAPFCSRLNVKIVDTENALQLASAGDLAIFYSEHFDRFREACRQLQRRNVATLYLIDGILEWRNAWENHPDEVACPYTMRPVLAHKVACIGNSQARVLDSWGNAGKTEIVGIPRLDDYADRTWKRETPDDVFRVLVMTAKTPGFTTEQILTTRQSLRDMKQWQSRNPKIGVPNSVTSESATRQTEFIWRLTTDLADEIGVDNQLTDLTGRELAEVLVNVDAVVTTPSTAMVESMRLGIPTATLDYHHCPLYVTAGWNIGSASQIGPALVQMCLRSPSRMTFQDQQLKDSLYLQANASERLIRLVQQMQLIASQQIADNGAVAANGLTFPAQILEPPSLQVDTLEHQHIFPNAVEFSQDDKTVLQVELSHARREIAHLQRELNQIRSELDQAHQIFEQIEKHPIAGPVVRIRQKMLDLMAAMRKRKNELDSTCPANVLNPAKSQAETRSNS